MKPRILAALLDQVVSANPIVQIIGASFILGCALVAIAARLLGAS